MLGGCTNNPYPEADDGKKVLYAQFDEPPKTLDPAVAYSTGDHVVTGKVFDTLLEYHYLKRPYELIPGLAQEVPAPESQPDGSTLYRFRLRDDLWFQRDACFGLSGGDTRRIVAQDVAFELMRIADPAVNSPVVDPFSNVRGFREFAKRLKERRKDPKFATLPVHQQYAEAQGIAGVTVAGDSELRLVLDQPYPQILYWFAMPFTTPVPWEAVAYYDGREGRDAFGDHPVASGPFVLSRYDRQARIVLERNPNWYGLRHPEWRAPGAVFPDVASLPPEALPPEERARFAQAAGQPLPFLERVEYRREKEPIPAFTKFLQGYYDSAGVVRESFNKVVQENGLSDEMRSRGMDLERSVVPAVFYIGFNLDDPLVGRAAGERSRKLRQAMSLAVDVGEYKRLFMNGRGLNAQSPLPPGIFGYDEEYQNPYRRVDLGRAKKLLEEAGYPAGVDPKTKRPLRLTFDVPDTSPESRLRFQFWVRQWRRLGIDVELAATTYNKFQEKVRDGAYQIFQWGWVADYPDPENFLFLLTTEMARSVSGGPNTANFKDARFDALFARMKVTPNGPERTQLIEEMRGILERERPWIELFHPEDYALTHGWLHHVVPAGLSIPTTKYHDVNPELRAELRATWNEPVLWPAFALIGVFAMLVVPGVITFYKERQ
jgi:ABC-type transport system substrate-binding protein